MEKKLHNFKHHWHHSYNTNTSTLNTTDTIHTILIQALQVILEDT